MCVGAHTHVDTYVDVCLDFLEPESQVAVNQILVLWKSEMCYELLCPISGRIINYSSLFSHSTYSY